MDPRILTGRGAHSNADISASKRKASVTANSKQRKTRFWVIGIVRAYLPSGEVHLPDGWYTRDADIPGR